MNSRHILRRVRYWVRLVVGYYVRRRKFARRMGVSERSLGGPSFIRLVYNQWCNSEHIYYGLEVW